MNFYTSLLIIVSAYEFV